MASKKKSAETPRPSPTLSHRLLSALEKAGRVTFLASQNYDDLFRDFPRAKLGELHGNIYTETCRSCGEVYHRDFEVRGPCSLHRRLFLALRAFG